MAFKLYIDGGGYEWKLPLTAWIHYTIYDSSFGAYYFGISNYLNYEAVAYFDEAKIYAGEEVICTSPNGGHAASAIAFAQIGPLRSKFACPPIVVRNCELVLRNLIKEGVGDPDVLELDYRHGVEHILGHSRGVANTFRASYHGLKRCSDRELWRPSPTGGAPGWARGVPGFAPQCSGGAY